MKRIAIITPPFLGHFNPTVGVGKELMDMGYSVCWFSQFNNIEEIIPEGGDYVKLPPFIHNQHRYKDAGGGKADLFSGWTLPYNNYLFEEMKGIISKEDFDFFMVDECCFAVSLLAHEWNLPFIVSLTTPITLDLIHDHAKQIENENRLLVNWQKSHGAVLPYPVTTEAAFKLVFTVKDFLRFQEVPESYKLVGASLSHRFEYEVDITKIISLDPNRPRVLISVGTIAQINDRVVDKIIQAFEHQDIHIILHADPALREQWPENFLVYDYIPQLKVLPYVDAVICHAGYNTVAETLSHGLPIVAIPFDYDQPYVAARVEAIGVGLQLSYDRLKSLSLRKALDRVLTDRSFRDKASEIRKVFEAAGGSMAAATLIETLLEKMTTDFLSQSSENLKLS